MSAAILVDTSLKLGSIFHQLANYNHNDYFHKN